MVSVVIPVYNSSNTIYQTLQSVVNQTYSGEIEIIVVNDGSEDNSLEVINEFCTDNANFDIKVFDKPNGGVSSARNLGMRMAAGDYIALLDSDDTWEADKLKRQLEILHQYPDIDLLGCNRNGEKFEGFFLKRFGKLVQVTSRLLLYKNFLPTPTVIFKRKILVNTGFFDENQRFAEEGNYWIRICHNNKCVLLNESHVITGGLKPNFGHSGLSANLKEMEKGELKNIKLALRLGVIGYFEFLSINFYSVVKYIRRIAIVKTR